MKEEILEKITIVIILDIVKINKISNNKINHFNKEKRDLNVKVEMFINCKKEKLLM